MIIKTYSPVAAAEAHVICDYTALIPRRIRIFNDSRRGSESLWVNGMYFPSATRNERYLVYVMIYR